MTTSLKCIKDESSQLSMWDTNHNHEVSEVESQQKNASTTASATAVEVLSSQMVSDIIQEVTRKGSAESVTQPEPTSTCDQETSAKKVIMFGCISTFSCLR